MKDISAIFLSRLGAIWLCRVTSEGAQSCTEPSTPFFFLPEGTAAGKGRLFVGQALREGPHGLVYTCILPINATIDLL